MFISLKPLEAREGLTTQQVIDRLRRKLYMVPGIRLFMFAAQDLRAGGRQSDSDYQFTLVSADLDLLAKWAPIVAKRMESVEGITDVTAPRGRGARAFLSIDATPPRASACRCGHRQRAQQRLLAAADLDHLPQRNHTSDLESSAPQGDPSACSTSTSAGANGAQVPLSRV